MFVSGQYNTLHKTAEVTSFLLENSELHFYTQNSIVSTEYQPLGMDVYSNYKHRFDSNIQFFYFFNFYLHIVRID